MSVCLHHMHKAVISKYGKVVRVYKDSPMGEEFTVNLTNVNLLVE